MEDINNALLHIKNKHNGEIPYAYGSKECAKLMDSYAKEYHQAKLKLLGIANVVKRTLERKEAAYACVNMWYEKEYDSSTPDDEVANMDKEAAELNAQIKVLRHIISEVDKL